MIYSLSRQFITHTFEQEIENLIRRILNVVGSNSRSFPLETQVDDTTYETKGSDSTNNHVNFHTNNTCLIPHTPGSWHSSLA